MGLAAIRGCVVFTQRFDSALRLNLHFHAPWLDGAFECAPRGPAAEDDFHPDLAPEDEDIARLARMLRQRLLRFLRKAGKLDDDTNDDEPPLLAIVAAVAAVQGRTALGPKAGAYAPRLDRGSTNGGEFHRGKLCADDQGFSLHAGVRVSELCRERLEKVCRYAARPPVIHDRRRPGATRVARAVRRADPAAPRPPHDVSRHPRARRRVPRSCRAHGRRRATHRGPVRAPPGSTRATPDLRPLSHQASQPASPLLVGRASAARLPRRVLTCERCGGRRTLFAAITAPDTLRRVLAHLGLATQPPAIAPARAPPGVLFH